MPVEPQRLPALQSVSLRQSRTHAPTRHSRSPQVPVAQPVQMPPGALLLQLAAGPVQSASTRQSTGPGSSEPASTPAPASVPESTPESTPAPASVPESTVAAASVPESTVAAESVAKPESMPPSRIGPESDAASGLAASRTKGASTAASPPLLSLPHAPSIPNRTSSKPDIAKRMVGAWPCPACRCNGL